MERSVRRGSHREARRRQGSGGLPGPRGRHAQHGASRGGRLSAQRLGLCQPAPIDEDNAVADSLDLGQLMGIQHDRRSPRLRLQDPIAHDHDPEGVGSGGRLV